MEHSYSRDWRPTEAVQNTRTVMVHKPPQCPSCHTHTHDEGVDLEESYNPPIPQYNEKSAKLSMEECEKAAYNVKNANLDDTDWEENINKFGWTNAQIKFFNRIAKVLDQDRLARLAYNERENEAVLRRAVIDKSVHRIRQAFASVSYDTRLLQWLHNILLDSLPPSYMTIYLDILQTMKLRLPTLLDKMLFCRQNNIVQELLAPVVKTKSWEPVIQCKNRKLPLSPIIITIPSSPIVGLQSSRLQKWFTLLSTMGTVIPIQMNNGPGSTINKLSIQSLTEHIISVSRAKIQEIRNENSQRPIILAGFNAGASLALQISLVEAINSIICIGFSYNTINGIRGQPDDLILDIKKPILFVIGQNSSRSSQEEIESLREKMISQTSLVVVGSGDDFLRVGKNKRKIEKVTQSMVDSMIMDEISEFCTNCLLNPPGPRQINVPLPVSQTLNLSTIHNRGSAVSATPSNNKLIRKRKISQGADENLVFNINSKVAKAVKNLNNNNNKISQIKSPSNPLPNVKKKVGRPKMHRPNIQQNRQQQSIITQPTTEALNIAIQSILPESEQSVTGTNNINENFDKSKILTSYEILNNKIKKTTIPVVGASSTSSTTVSGIGGTPILLPVFDRSKVNIIPSNQFVQLKPPHGNNAQRVYTLKTSPKQQQQQSSLQKQPLYTVRTQQPGENQAIRSNTIYTVKSTPAGTQLLSTHDNTTLGKSSSIVLNPKYTVIKPNTNDNATSTITTTKLQPDLSSTNIFDIPIVFADNDGNIHDSNESSLVLQQQTACNDDNKSIIQPSQNTTAKAMQSNLSNIVQSQQQPQQSRNIIINSMLSNSEIITNSSGSNTNQPKHNKTVVLINRNTMKPCSNLITKTISTSNMQPIKFTKVLVNTSKMPHQQQSQQHIQFSSGNNAGTTTFTYAGQGTSSSSVNSSNKVEILNSTLIKGPTITSSQSVSTTSAVTSPSTTSGVVTSSPSTINMNKYQPIIIHMDPDNKLRNVIKVSGVNNTNIIGGTGDGMKKNTIVLKPNTTFKQIPMLKSGILNKNLTVRKVVNYVTTTSPGQQATSTTVTLNKQQMQLQPQQQQIDKESN